MNSAVKKSGSNKNSRRKFLRKFSLLIFGMGTVRINCFSKSNQREQLRLIAYNVLKCTGYPSDKMINKAIMPSLIAQELSKYKPDIINFSESPDEIIVKEIADKLKMNYVMFPSAGNWPGTVITRYKILETHNVPIGSGDRPADLFTRHWGKAKLQLPNDRIIIIHSAHLFPRDTPESGEIRKRELTCIIQSIKKDAAIHNSAILMGDLNLTPNSPEYKQLMDNSLIDSFVIVGSGDGFTMRSDNPTRRIDYIMAIGSIANQIIESRPLSEGLFIVNNTNPDSYALSDHIPQYAVFEF